MIQELQKLKEEIIFKIDAMISWAQENGGIPSPIIRPNRRLKMFMDEHERAFGCPYFVRDYVSEGGAAKRTEMKCNDPDYIAAVQAYLANREEAFGSHFNKFIGRLEYWVRVAKEINEHE